MNKACPLFGFCSRTTTCDDDCKTYIEEKALRTLYQQERHISCVCGNRFCVCREIGQEDAQREYEAAQVINNDVGRYLNDATK